jgi:hypothetical protein
MTHTSTMSAALFGPDVACPSYGGDPLTPDPESCCDRMLDDWRHTSAELEADIQRERDEVHDLPYGADAWDDWWGLDLPDMDRSW